MSYNYVSDIPEEYELVDNSQDIFDVLESIGMSSEIDEYGGLFVLVGDGEYDIVYGCASSVAWLDSRVDLLYDSASKHAVAPGQLALYDEEPPLEMGSYPWRSD